MRGSRWGFRRASKLGCGGDRAAALSVGSRVGSGFGAGLAGGDGAGGGAGLVALDALPAGP